MPPPQPGWGPPQQQTAQPVWGPPAEPVWLPPYEPPRRRRGLLVSIVVLVVLLVAGGGVGAYLFLHRPADGTGKASATEAAQAFLTAVYQTRDADAVAPLVCGAARDRKRIQAKIDEIVRQDKQYQKPRYDWTQPQTQSTTKDRAVVTTTVSLSTDEEQTASQKLTLTVIHSTGWFVCDVQTSPVG